MHCNAMIIPVLALAAVFFAAGSRLQRRTGLSRARNWSLVTLLALAIPGLLMDLYYLHILDNASWFYAMRATPWSELSLAGLGLLAGSSTLGENQSVPARRRSSRWRLRSCFSFRS